MKAACVNIGLIIEQPGLSPAEHPTRFVDLSGRNGLTIARLRCAPSVLQHCIAYMGSCSKGKVFVHMAQISQEQAEGGLELATGKI